MRVLLDQNCPRGLRSALDRIEVRTAYGMGWAELSNGHLLDAAERQGFDVLLTADQNVSYQQNLSGRRLSIVVLSSNRWTRLQRCVALVRSAVESAAADPGCVIVVTVPDAVA